MSNETVEIVQRIFDSWGAGDFGAGLTELDPDVVFVVRHPFPEAVRTVGPDGIARYLRRFLDNWETYAVEASEFRAAGDTVVVDALQHGRGKASQIDMERRLYMLFTFRGRKIVRIESILERDQALEAAGLGE